MSASLDLPSNNLGPYEFFICIYKEHKLTLSEAPLENNHRPISCAELIYMYITVCLMTALSISVVSNHIKECKIYTAYKCEMVWGNKGTRLR